MQIFIVIFLGLLLLYFVYVRTRSAMLQRPLQRLPAVLFDIPRFRWRFAKVDVTTNTYLKEYGKLWLSLISDLK